MDAILEDIRTRKAEINRRLEEIHVQFMDELDTSRDTPWGSKAYRTSQCRLDELSAERSQLSSELAELGQQLIETLDQQENEEANRPYHRPEGGLATLLNKGLGPLPEGSVVVEPSEEALAEIGSYRLPALITVVVAISLLIGLVKLLPWMGYSPLTVILMPTIWLGDGSIWWLVGTLVVAYIAFKLVGKYCRAKAVWPRSGKFLDRAAAAEEQWFRSGAESWTFGRRLTSCLLFGLVHITNFIYPIASLLVVGLVLGGACMVVYTREYRRSGDYTRATLASAKFHASYNRFAIAYMVVALLTVFVVMI